MATIRERIDSNGKKSYHAQVRLKGFPPQTKTFDSKTIAKQWAAHVESELRTGRYMPRVEAQRHTVRELLDEYRKKVLVPTKPKEVSSQGQQLDWWAKKLGAYSLADLTPVLIAKCRDELLDAPFPDKGRKKSRENGGEGGVDKEERKRKPATVVRYMAVLSHALNVAVKEWQWLDESPMAKVSKPRVNNERLRYLSDEEQARLLQAAKDSENRYLHTIIVLALSTGMRYGEIINLRWQDVLIESGETFGLIMYGCRGAQEAVCGAAWRSSQKDCLVVPQRKGCRQTG